MGESSEETLIREHDICFRIITYPGYIVFNQTGDTCGKDPCSDTRSITCLDGTPDVRSLLGPCYIDPLAELQISEAIWV